MWCLLFCCFLWYLDICLKLSYDIQNLYLPLNSYVWQSKCVYTRFLWEMSLWPTGLCNSRALPSTVASAMNNPITHHDSPVPQKRRGSRSVMRWESRFDKIGFALCGKMGIPRKNAFIVVCECWLQSLISTSLIHGRQLTKMVCFLKSASRGQQSYSQCIALHSGK